MKKNIPVAQLFAGNLVTHRRRKGLSQGDLARIAGISGRMITRYETEGVIPPAERLQALVDALEIPVGRLFEHAAEPPDSKTDLTGIDARSVKKLRDILSLPTEDRNDLYRILNKLVRKQQAEQRERDYRPSLIPQ
jgi:transcriptional regulator with XRE-family HTH domain